MSGTSSNTSTAPAPNNWLPKLIGALLLGLILLVFYFNTTQVSGIEFNPGSWQMRSFSFRADPFTGFQWTGIQHETSTFKADKSIIALLDPKAKKRSNRWDLAEIHQFSVDQTGPSVIMLQLLTGYGSARGFESVEFWVQWTADNPNKAKVFWPAIQELAAVGAYSQVPSLLELPVSLADDQLFAEQLDQHMLEALRFSMKEYMSNGDKQAAAAAAQAGLKYSAEDPELTEVANISVD